jgi:hypothetical protein
MKRMDRINESLSLIDILQLKHRHSDIERLKPIRMQRTMTEPMKILTPKGTDRMEAEQNL